MKWFECSGSPHLYVEKQENDEVFDAAGGKERWFASSVLSPAQTRNRKRFQCD